MIRYRCLCRLDEGSELIGCSGLHAPSAKPLQRTNNSSLQLTVVAAWWHTVSAGSRLVSAVAGR
jgi:hypothetical protein